LETILVTGGAGFIGSNIVRHSLNRGYNVRVLDNLSTGSKSNIAGLPVEFIEGDVTDKEIVKGATRDVRFIFHDAAVSASPMFVPDPSHGINVNVMGFANVISSAIANGVEKVVYVMTSSMYGNSKPPWAEDKLLVSDVPNIYASSLLDRAFIANQVEKTSGIKTVGLVYFSVYGPYEAAKKDYANIISQFLWSIKKSDPPILYGDGSQTRDFVHAEDVAKANLLAAESAYSGGYVNVGTGVSVSMKDVVDKLCEIMGSDIEPIYKPNPIYGYCYHTLADVSKAKRNIGFEASIGIDEGLKSLVRFYEDKQEMTA